MVSLGLKGVLAVELRVRTANSDAHSGNGGLYPNAVWRLVEALATLRAPDGRVTVDGFNDALRPPTPAEEAMLAAIPFDAAAIQRSLGMAGFLGGLDGAAALRRLMFEPTCTINGIWGGYSGPGSKTVIPCQAAAKLDFRLAPDQTPEEALRLLRAHLARRGFADIAVVDEEDGLMPARTDPAAAVVRAAVAAVTGVHGAAPVVQPSSAGSGPMYQLCQAYGIPAVNIELAGPVPASTPPTSRFAGGLHRGDQGDGAGVQDFRGSTNLPTQTRRRPMRSITVRRSAARCWSC